MSSTAARLPATIKAATYTLEQNGIRGLDLAAPAGIRESLYMAVREDWSILTGIISRVIIDLDPTIHREIRRRWLGPPERRTLDLLPDQLFLAVSTSSLLQT